MPVISDAVLARAEAEVVPLLQQMVACDTTIAEHDDPPRQERAHQELIAAYLRDIGAEVTLAEPAVEEFRGHPMYRPNQTFEGRPILWARLPGSGGGRSLLFNGHYDTVIADPIADWSHGPWSGDVADGKLYGRGSCDMKGGIACALAMAAALVAEGVELPGDLLFNIVPFEEVNGMGTTATMLRGHRADAAVCCEPTELDTLIACRGVLLGRLTIEGRSAHAEIIQPHHSEGGGVNAIDKLVDVLLALRALNDDWRQRPDKRHWLLSPPSVLTTMAGGGAFASNWPAEAWAILNSCYLPGEADDAGYGSRVMREIEACIDNAAAADSWLRDHRPAVEWLCDFPPEELDREHELVRSARALARRHGAAGELIGFDSWADQVMLMKEGGIPCICLGPGSIGRAHAVDEFVPLADLATCTRIYAELAATWTAGVAAGDTATPERPEEDTWPS